MRTCDPKRGEQILEAAAQLFAKHRYHEVRMDDIATHAGVAKGTLYRYYKDKEALYRALAIHGLQRLYAESHDTIVGPGDADAKLHAFIVQVVAFYEHYPYYLELIQRVESSKSAQALEALQDMRSRFYHLISDLLAQFNGCASHVSHHPQLGALALLGMIRGILRFTPQPWPEYLAEWIYKQFKHGLCAESVEHQASAIV